MMLNKAAVAVAFTLGFGLASSANAEDFYLGDINPPQTYSQVVDRPVGDFSDRWNFTIVEPTFSGGSVSNLSIRVDEGVFFNISSLSAQLYAGDGTFITNLDLNPGSNDEIKVGHGTFGTDAFGDYYFAVSGTADGSLGGKYVFSVTTLPVPEPETYAMLLAGLGLLGVVARRRMNS